MRKFGLLFCCLFAFAAFMTYSLSAGAENSDESKMVKEIAFGVMENGPSEEAIEKEYLVNHGPQITSLSGSIMYKYQLWLPYEPPDDAVKLFNAVRGRYAELWYPSMEVYANRPGSGGGRGDQQPKMEPSKTDGRRGSPVPWEETRAEKRVVVLVPGRPTETFLDLVAEYDKAPSIRWVTAIRYSEKVSVEDGEKWFLNVHAKEAVKQPGLKRFVSYRVYDNQTFAAPGVPSRWVRVNEYWYENFAAWRKAVIESPPKYTAPNWGGKYPFVEMESTFVPYLHYVDFLKGGYVVTEK
jgi:hypothetical protein